MPSAALTLTRAFCQLCVFRIGPQDIPASNALLLITAVLNLSLSALINNIQLPLASAVLVAVLELLVLASLTSAILFYFAHLPRLRQTLTALFGSGAVIGGTVWVLLSVFEELPNPVRMCVFLWNLLVMAHVIRHAVSVHIVAAFFMALAYALSLIQLIIFVGRLLSAPVA
jgi:hypothetical protein